MNQNQDLRIANSTPCIVIFDIFSSIAGASSMCGFYQWQLLVLISGIDEIHSNRAPKQFSIFGKSESIRVTIHKTWFCGDY